MALAAWQAGKTLETAPDFSRLRRQFSRCLTLVKGATQSLRDQALDGYCSSSKRSKSCKSTGVALFNLDVECRLPRAVGGSLRGW